MILFFVVLILAAIGFWAYNAAVDFIEQFSLVRLAPGVGSELITGWDLFLYGWPFMLLGAVLALIVLPAMTRSYRAANHADLKRTLDTAQRRVEAAEERAKNASDFAESVANKRYDRQFRELNKRIEDHEQAVKEFEDERFEYISAAEHWRERSARSDEEREAADKAKNNAMSAATRLRKKVEALKATIDDLTSGNR